MLTPRVQVYGDTAIVNYTLLKTMVGDGEPPQFSTDERDTGVRRLDGVWKMVHLHKSPAG